MEGCDSSDRRRHLPEDVLTFILLRLPLKSAVRFKCVCKSWLALISRPDFIIKCLNRSNSAANLLVRRVVDRNTEALEFSVFSSDQSLDENARPITTLRPDFLALDDSWPILIGPCNGVLLVHINGVEEHHYGVVLWNPSTEECLELPPSPVPRYPYSGFADAYGFGFDPKTGDYKIVRFLNCSSDDPLTSCFQQVVELYTRSSGSWREIRQEEIEGFNLLEIDVDPSTVGAYKNAALHWLVSFGCGGRTMILSFEVSDEVFDLMPLPPHLGYPYLRLFLLDDMIGLVHYPWDESVTTTSLSIWVMNEYGVGESWVKILTVGPVFGLYSPEGLWNNGEFLLQRRDGEVVSYDPTTQKVFTLQYAGETYGTPVIIYKGFSPSGFNLLCT
ncbi:F-box/kelch-repeat protein At3g06240-like [Malania oleifera]|uniref:F-box/kelch-repeat protein At3g06240-like n=1 Tax=Malania oleifera TaxID=397392 RepID=UPI0025AE067B|nr:F-box/kelch-repeat protein At3g06240-like [Malania oleifera]